MVSSLFAHVFLPLLEKMYLFSPVSAQYVCVMPRQAVFTLQHVRIPYISFITSFFEKKKYVGTFGL